MAALVQSYPQQSGTVTMLQARPASASGMLQPSQGQGGQSFGVSQQQRNSFYGTPSGLGASPAYRGSSAPIQPYAFTATPSLNPGNQWQHFRDSRASSSPSVPTTRSLDHTASGLGRPRHPASSSMTNLHSSPAMGYSTGGSRDDSALPGGSRRAAAANPRPQSAYMTGSATATQVTFAQATPIKISPERYRRPSARTTDSSGSVQQAPTQGSAPPSGSGMATVGHLYNGNNNNNNNNNSRSSRAPAALDNRPQSCYATATGPATATTAAAADDIQLYRHHPHEEAKRFRRRSMPALDSADYPKPLTPHLFKQPDDSSRPEQLAEAKTADKDIKTARVVVVKSPVASAAGAMQSRNGSSDSLVSSHSSGHSRPSSAARNTTAPSSPTPTGNPASPSTVTEQQQQQSGAANKDYPRLVNIPPRGSSSDVANRVTNPSPLSKPVTMDSATDAGESPAAGDAPTTTTNAAAASPSSPVVVDSPAVKQLSAINQKGGKRRGKSSRLRRAFSFGSAAEFRKAANPDEAGEGSGSGSAGASGASAPAKLHKEPTAEELYDAEQARIAQKQEEAGIGNNIYAGARIFSGSTDNLSISSTASSASIMIRKMGRGMKKGTRSLVGLFRPKSVVGVPAADAQAPPEASQAAVSMITVEAERERVNVNLDPHTQHGGGTGFPRLERNSIDAARADSAVSERLGSSGTDNSGARKSIVGGEKERAEVLAAVRRGILKNSSGSSSPPRGTTDSKTAVFDPPNVPAMTESPVSSAPSTPNDEAQGHKRTGPVTIGSEDYFMTALRLRQDTKSAPNTPQGTLKRNATFSPRIVFHDTWPSQEYDRRGEIATCNRLTPMLAQQIKEELNSFKMEMEVHENSKIYTHFF